MTYTEFKNKWLGKGIDFDGSFGFQCVDVYRMYCKEVLQIPQSPGVAVAKNIWDTYLKEYFDKIINTKEAVPKQGDVIIWGMEPYGHIAICDSANGINFISFEQNWTELNGSGKTELRTHNYKNVLGWLKPKTTQQGENMTEEQKRILEFLTGKTEGDVREAFGALADLPNKNAQISTLSQKVLELDNVTKKLQEQIDILTSEVKSNNEIIMDWQSKFKTANEQVSKATEQLNTITNDRNKYRRLYENLLSTTVDKYSAFELIKLGLKKLFVK